MIDRKMYLDRLISNRERDIIKVVTGVRRCGKSTLFKLYIDYLKSTGVKDDQMFLLSRPVSKQLLDIVREQVLLISCFAVDSPLKYQ